jgi:2,4-dienoyl-CoA reductase-like NADH-dependent reductase (Old Yellow Enzyme family)
MPNFDGSVSSQVMAYYAEKAKGGAAAITWGILAVEFPRGKTGDVKNRADTPKYRKRYEQNGRRHPAIRRIVYSSAFSCGSYD